MTVRELVTVLHDSDRVRILDKCAAYPVIFDGWLATVKTHPDLGKVSDHTLDRDVVEVRAVPEIRHKEWERRRLEPPMDPEQTPLYSFRELEMRLYYDIYVE